MHYIKRKFLSAALFAASVHGHMKMASPVPYGIDTLNNSPLNADGSDFPCKLRSDTYAYTAATLQQNTFHVGDSPLLSFIGSATHGGGSCQVSLTTDLEPSVNSTWMVIHSIEGGCPANVTGNLGGGADTVDPTTFHFTIPDIAEGRYSLAWTWFNRVGNREMYMNCAPVLILPKSGSSKKRETTFISKRTDFPELFVANINECMTPEGVDIRFPNPGDSVEYDGTPSNLQPSGSAACTGGAGITATGSYPAATPTLTGTAIGSSGDASGGSSGSAPTASDVSSLSISPTSTTYTAPTETTVVPETPATTAPSTSSTSPTSGGLSGACATEGEWNCIDGTYFQRCASGMWSAVGSVAAGTNCTSGLSNDLSIVADKREHPGHIHRRRHSLFGHSQ
ncbi:hypothetical protein UA08_00450 [Talaromyces atroroseus]|uniref:Chitin-binding type-4 domain-containing protein n=1 Tax=Talaromyces atroroseus TaxID=1441469 RepID=A0A225B9B3_TALAT|nr:hypothetical protein UA08_00450 [Talaromyces atroroseus]OKL63986.1 hypothetical protein UA08_00450 [Talaromyces atroroseus]